MSTRLFIFLAAVFISFSVIGYRLLDLTYFQYPYYKAIAKNQESYGNFSSRRGDIFIKDRLANKLLTISTTRKNYYLYFVPNNTASPDEVINKLNGIIQLDPDKTLQLISDANGGFKILAENLLPEQIEQIKKLNIKGTEVGVKNERFYPLGDLAANVIGFLGFQGNERLGQYGVEGFYDELLRGSQKKTQALVLSLDFNIQYFVEEKLREVLKKWESPRGSIIVQDPQSGAILAMANLPAFNPNEYKEYSLEKFVNLNIQEIFEPGSSFKPITMAAALDSNAITPENTYYDPGFVEISGYKINNFDEKSHGRQSMSQVLEKSLNTGAIHVEKLTGHNKFLAYVEAFGFGRKTGIDLFAEISGDITNLYQKRPINFVTASFGQGIAVTPLQLINAYSAIANGGKLMKPYIVEEIILDDGSKKQTVPQIVSRPINEESSRQLKNMLVSVVDRGFDKARIKGYEIAGKTGTAQIPNKDRSGYSDEFIHNFVGFAPASDPKFVVLIKMDKPKGIKFAADSLSPVFGEIARFLINYYAIPPTR